MASPVRTEAIVVWDIENTRVPVALRNSCYEIVQVIVADVQERTPASTVLKVFVAGTFDNYPGPIKTALCTHPRVQLLYSVGKGAKGGEADDALKRVILDFHSSQIAAGKQAVIALLSGDADYNDVVDAARVANHKVYLYHSAAVAHTLKGNVDYSEPWLSFLARKFQQSAEELEDVGFVLRHSIPNFSMGTASNSVSRANTHTPPGLQPIPLHYCNNGRPRSAQSHQTPVLQVKRHPGADGQRTPSMPSGTDVAPGTPHQSDVSLQHTFQSAPMHQHHTQYSSHQAWLPQSGAQPVLQASRASGKQLTPSASQSQHSSYNKPSMTDASFQHGQRPQSANSMPLQRGSSDENTATNPCSDGRSVVINGFKKGMPGFEAKERALAACRHFGAVSLSWLRKGRTGCWFVIAQFEKEEAAQAMTKQGSSRYSKNGALAVRWYYSEAPPASATPAPHQQAVKDFAPALTAVGADVVDSRQGQPLSSKALPVQPDTGLVVPVSQNVRTAGILSSHMKSICQVPRCVTVFSISFGTFMRLVAGTLMLTGYFVLLASGY